MINRISKISFVVISFLVLLGYNIQGQGIKEIYIECDQDEFDYIYANYEQDIYIPAIIGYGDDTWTDVLLRLRGDSSRKYPKKSLKLQFDSEPFANGRFVLNFNAEYHDRGYLHSTLSSILFNKIGVPCADMEHVRLYLNNAFFGLYIMTENMDEQFLEELGLDTNGPLYKASRDGACLSIYDNVFFHWDHKSGDDPYRAGLSNLIHDLNSVEVDDFPTFLQSKFNSSNLKGFIAMSMLLGNGSTYYHNYFLYFNPENDLWNIYPWDLDKTFSNFGILIPYHRSSGYWTPDNPLLEKSLLNAQEFENIKNELASLNSSVFTTAFIYPIIDSIQNVIAASVAEDTTDDIPDLAAWEAEILEDKMFIEQRYSEMLNQMNNIPVSFTVERENEVFAPGQENTFNWSPSSILSGGPFTYSFYLSQDISFESSETIIIEGITENMLTINLPETEGKYYWTIEATTGFRDHGGFDTYNTLYINSKNEHVVINEINYNSHPDFDVGDWVEFYNPGDEQVDLEGWKFKDQDDNHIYIFPEETSIGAGEFLVLCRNTQQFFTLFPQTIPAIGDFDFGFSSNGDLLRLYNNIDYLVDEVQYQPEMPWPEDADGNGPSLELLNPGLDNAMAINWAASFDHGTPGEQNGKYSPDFIPEEKHPLADKISVFPNPFVDYIELWIEAPASENVSIIISNSLGQVCFNRNFLPTTNDNSVKLETNSLNAGIYTCTVVVKGFIPYSFVLVKQ